MKKVGIIIILIIAIVFLPLISSLIKAQEQIPGEQLDPNKLGSIDSVNLSDLNDKTQIEYIEQSWDDLKTRNPAVSQTSDIVSPFMKAFTGYDFDISVAFIIALIISIVYCYFIYNGVSAFWDNGLATLAIAVISTIILNAIGLTRDIVPKIESMIQWTTRNIIFLIIGAIILILLFRWINRKLKASKKASDKEKADENFKKASEKISNIAEGMQGKGIYEGLDENGNTGEI